MISQKLYNKKRFGIDLPYELSINDIAESGKKVTIIRDGETNEEGKIGDVVVGDIIKLKSGMEIPGDGVVLTSFSL